MPSQNHTVLSLRKPRRFAEQPCHSEAVLRLASDCHSCLTLNPANHHSAAALPVASEQSVPCHRSAVISTAVQCHCNAAHITYFQPITAPDLSLQRHRNTILINALPLLSEDGPFHCITHLCIHFFSIPPHSFSLLYLCSSMLIYAVALQVYPLLCPYTAIRCLARLHIAFQCHCYQSNVELRRCALFVVMPTSAIALL